ncbi:peptidylprolyl isomerase [Arsenophonus nasoniae]|uniref:Periplasmic chaperone PpiD n=1 Tax=Arsenophonus nasoniae TaxID=638 RepID=D2TWD0_9GAMM|nr:peptidylprolyl isomerase [Arsenophonus nasoniae]QBY44884.1 Peptidyl-prolyl cis-trans isomerase D [Arsenophonus nasoniae]WGM05126.1 peptidylprolyl isomerase [Arsenophonus nasoniae]WGM10138.1 peptidylprolyl isomerase [Arsenophonus nasoniae]WGM14851.1 peptidylprolyl isomerase [Arsenophonus nasoniae]CBA71661.1 peptidyl-prolyl cis-trans isomerase D [Arsenophonus nasoniae]
MMDNLRTAANSLVLKIVFVIIILSFVLTGVGSYLIGGSSNHVAKVNGTAISQVQLQQAFQQEKQVLQERLGDQFAEIASSEQGMQMLRRQALERLIGVTLLNQYSNQLGLTASDNQVKQDIYNMPIFQTDGHFDSEKYRTILSQHNVNADDLAQEIRQNLINRQLSKMYITDEFVLPEEVKSYAQLLLQQREVKTATLSLANYQSKQTVTDKELQDYYNAHQNSFISPEQVQVSYIKLDAASQRENVAVKDEELKNYYEQNIANFTQPAQKHYSMIQLPTEKEADSVVKSLAGGADFKQLVAEKSTDKFSAANHGALGWMEATSTPSEIIAANLTKKGQISAVIKSASNYIIFRLDDIKPEVVKPFQSVKTEIANTLKNEKAINAFYSLQQTASRAAMDDNESLTAAEKATGIKAVTTGWFSRNNLPEEIRFDKVADTIFNGNLVDKNGPTGINSDVINVDGDRAFVIRVEKYKPQVTQPFDEVKKTVAELVKLNKATKEMEAEGNKLLTALKQGAGEAALAKLGINFGDAKIIERFEQNDVLVEPIFQMPIPKENTPTYFSTKDAKNNLVIIQLIKVTQGQPTDEELKVFSQRYKMILGNVMMESLMLNLRDSAKVDLGRME